MISFNKIGGLVEVQTDTNTPDIVPRDSFKFDKKDNGILFVGLKNVSIDKEYTWNNIIISGVACTDYDDFKTKIAEVFPDAGGTAGPTLTADYGIDIINDAISIVKGLGRISNGDFFSGSDEWLLGDGWSINGGVAEHDGVSPGGRIGNYAFFNVGINYAPDDVVTVAGGNVSHQFIVLTVDGNGGILTMSMTQEGNGYAIGLANLTGGTGSGAQIIIEGVTDNYLKQFTNVGDMVQDALYMVGITVDGATGGGVNGSIRVSLGGGNETEILANAGDEKILTRYFLGVGENNFTIIIKPISQFNGYVDNITVNRVYDPDDPPYNLERVLDTGADADGSRITSVGYPIDPTDAATKGYIDDKIPYLLYVALITQSGTNDPTVTELQNNLGGNPVWARTDVGEYTATLTGAFTQDKTFIMCGQPDNGQFGSAWTNVNSLFFQSATNVGTTSDNILSKTAVEIRVYP